MGGSNNHKIPTYLAKLNWQTMIFKTWSVLILELVPADPWQAVYPGSSNGRGRSLMNLTSPVNSHRPDEISFQCHTIMYLATVLEAFSLIKNCPEKHICHSLADMFSEQACFKTIFSYFGPAKRVFEKASRAFLPDFENRNKSKLMLDP
ncbi:MAG: hypothetical protein DWQ10_15475 [Calditrichaeota bacterium]|nr:MAG: hypothetical protein DWQ10_15475 [Calditrichota bacterium]